MPTKATSKLTRRPGKGAEKLLGELELAIMRIAWSREAMTVRDVLDVLKKKRPLAYTTVMTVMSRLADKGLLVAEKSGKSYRYRAAHTRETFEAQAAGQVVQALINDFGGDIALRQFVRGIAESNPDQLDQLARLARLAQHEPNED
jgi:predicted transcriptional regulator